jgi:hypothetical protein
VGKNLGGLSPSSRSWSTPPSSAFSSPLTLSLWKRSSTHERVLEKLDREHGVPVLSRGAVLSRKAHGWNTGSP